MIIIYMELYIEYYKISPSSYHENFLNSNGSREFIENKEENGG